MTTRRPTRREAIGLGAAAAAAAGVTLAAGPAQARRQPNMHEAIKHLRKAEAALERSSTDKGGHRKRAIDLVREAIRETERGIRYAN